jgi:hypothetical protein
MEFPPTIKLEEFREIRSMNGRSWPNGNMRKATQSRCTNLRPASPLELPPYPHTDFDQGAHSDRVSLYGAKRRTGAHATFQTRHGALGGPHPRGDFLLCHSRGGPCSYEIGHERLQYAISRQRPRMPFLARFRD